MHYNFDEVINRTATNSLKWQVKEGVLPMWVADMDFQTAPEVIEVLKERIEHGVFGYNIVPESWNEAICHWWEKRHHYKMEKEWLVFCTGVVPAISSIVRKMTTIGEDILIMTPVYNIFFNSIVNNGRHILESKLTYEEGAYYIDFDDLEQKLARPQTTMLILCNPHNPVGKIWDIETLRRIGELCEEYHVLVVSDEIHCDLTDPGYGYIPFASVSPWCAQNSITCLAPTKAFNLAGLQTAAVMIPNPVLRQKVERGLNTDEVAEPNSFAIQAVEAAFTKGEDWLDALRQYIFENKQIVQKFIEEELPQVKLVDSKATYLLWLDCRSISRNSNEMCEYLIEKLGIMLSSGQSYGESGAGFLRLNIACPKKQLQEGLERLKKGFISYEDYCKSVGN